MKFKTLLVSYIIIVAFLFFFSIIFLQKYIYSSIHHSNPAIQIHRQLYDYSNSIEAVYSIESLNDLIIYNPDKSEVGIGSIVIIDNITDEYAFFNFPFPGSAKLSSLKYIKLYDAYCDSNFFLENIDFPGNDIPGVAPLSVNNANDCCYQCSVTKACSFWTFTSPDSTCWLKGSSATIPLRHPKQGTISGDYKRNYLFDNSPNWATSNFLKNSVHSNDTTDISQFSFRILQNSEISTEWAEQFPIGNGKFGAFVGGSLREEVLPFSNSKLFFGHKPQFSNVSLSAFAEFQSLRNSTRNGFFSNSKYLLPNLRITKNDQFMFQYIADVIIKISPAPWKYKNTSITGLNTKNNPFKIRQGQPVLGDDANFDSRASRLQLLRSKFDSNDAESNKPLYSSATLNMLTGISQHLFIEKFHDKIYLHKRYWFASSVDNVIVGKLQLLSLSSKSPADFSIIFQLSREMNPDFQMPENKIKFLPINSTTTKFYLTLKSQNDVVLPMVVLCGAIICRDVKELDNSSLKEGLVCNDLKHSEIYSSSLTSKDLLPLDECLSYIDKALDLGYDALKLRHIEAFSQQMSTADLSFLAPADVSSCSHMSSITPDRIMKFGEYLNENKTISQNISICDKLLVSQLFHYGRYLLISSGNNGVSNLQGLWADGPKAAWNGDYHFNINMEMIYWSLGVSNLDSVFPALLEFLEVLASNRKGQLAAKVLYGCEGWMAHGFTDITMTADILGDAEWALCVSCGAWLAVTVFDQILFQKFNESVMNRMIPILQGAVNFFQSYLFLDTDGTLNSGPSTSPENSYRIIFNTSNIGPLSNLKAKNHRLVKNNRIKDTQDTSQFNSEIAVLALNPAIDISIIRQLANSYVLLLQWMISLNKGNYERELKDALDFQNLIRLMPGSAMPMISSNGLVLEYPKPFNEAIVGFSHDEILRKSKDKKDLKFIDESLDYGHRHFSSMHWLFPNTFHSLNASKLIELRNAAIKTIDIKEKFNGGHTSWSSSWLSCLHARLGNSKKALLSIRNIIQRFMTTNLLSLHPQLYPNVNSDERCRTCFSDNYNPNMLNSLNNFHAHPSRGFVTMNEAKFQLDGNLGIVAALSEMLIQSHQSGMIVLLPSIPRDFLEYGFYKGLRARGNIQISIVWSKGNIIAGVLELQGYHPFLEPVTEYADGFFRLKNIELSNKLNLKIASPNKLIQLNNSCSQWNYLGRIINDYSYLSIYGKRFHSGELELSRDSFPCHIYLCDFSITITQEECLRQLTKLRKTK